MKIRPFDALVLRRLVIGRPLNGELQALSERFRPLAEGLNATAPEDRPIALQGFLWGCADSDRDRIIEAMTIDPDSALPEPESDGLTYATLADIARIVSDQPWLWRGWIARDVLNVLASEPGTGKTRFALDLARRLWFQLLWPDGQANEMPVGTRTLWIQGDRAFHEMLLAARAFGLPEEAVVLGSSPDDPTGSLNLDDPETLAALAERIEAAAPGLMIIDTVGMTTDRNLCRPEDARSYFAPLMDLASKYQIPILGLTHLSKDKEALGRRIVEKARVVIKMTHPDPEGQPDRRRLWVDKSAVIKPPPLGITMGDEGNDYDSTPPSEPPPVTSKAGRPPEAKEKAKQFAREALTLKNDRVGKDLAAEFENAGGCGRTLWRAVDEMADAGELTKTGGTGTGKQVVLHLIRTEPEPDSPF